VSESQLGRITAGTEHVLRSDAVTIPPPRRPPTLSSGRCADCLRRGTGRAPRRAPRAESNVYSPRRCSPTRRPAKAESAAVQSSQIWPATHPIRKEKRQQGSETRTEGCRATVVSHFRAGPGALRRAKRGGEEERSREGLEAEPEQPRSLLICTRVPVAGLSLFGETATSTSESGSRLLAGLTAGVPRL
jgi:hypothetical protein